MATDFVEIVGGAIALYLLFGIPLPVGGAFVGLAGALLLMLKPNGRNRFQVIVGVLLAVVVVCFVYQALHVGVRAGDVTAGLRPSFGNDAGLLLATGIIGATIMPHAIYVHSALTSERRGPVTSRTLQNHRLDIVLALGVATVTNVAILLVAARALHVPGAVQVVDTLESAYAGLRG